MSCILVEDCLLIASMAGAGFATISSTVSMGLSPIMAIYQARFNRYLEDRGLKKKMTPKWAFLGRRNG